MSGNRALYRARTALALANKELEAAQADPTVQKAGRVKECQRVLRETIKQMTKHMRDSEEIGQTKIGVGTPVKQ